MIKPIGNEEREKKKKEKNALNAFFFCVVVLFPPDLSTSEKRELTPAKNYLFEIGPPDIVRAEPHIPRNSRRLPRASPCLPLSPEGSVDVGWNQLGNILRGGALRRDQH